METNNESTSNPRRAWYEIRFPALYLLVGVMLFGSAAFGVIVDGQSLISSAVSFLAGTLLVLAALLTFPAARAPRSTGGRTGSARAGIGSALAPDPLARKRFNAERPDS